MNANEKKIETIEGHEKALAYVEKYVRNFNEGNEREGSEKMTVEGMRAQDGAGSGEFIEAREIEQSDVFEIFVLA